MKVTYLQRFETWFSWRCPFSLQGGGLSLCVILLLYLLLY